MVLKVISPQKFAKATFKKRIEMLPFELTHGVLNMVVVIWCLGDFHGSLKRP